MKTVWTHYFAFSLSVSFHSYDFRQEQEKTSNNFYTATKYSIRMSETELSPPPIPASNASLTLRLQPLLERLPPAEQAGMRRVLAAVVKEEEASSSSGGESGNIKVSDSLRTRAAELHQLLARYDAKEISLEEAKLRIAKIAVDAALEFRHEIYSKLFNSISTEKAKQLVKSSDIVKSSGGQNTSLTYGEIDLFSFACILEKLGSKAGDVFVDLGHGTGKALVCASLFLGDLSRVVGIEIVPELTRVSENVRDELRRVTSACVPEYWTVPPIEVFEGDILTDTCCGFDWTTAGIIMNFLSVVRF